MNTISGATISGATISGAVISDATISDATITGATISGAKITGGKLSGDTLTGGTVAGGTVSGGTVAGGTVAGGTVKGGTITGGTISGGTISRNGAPQAPAPPSKPGPETKPAAPAAGGAGAKREASPGGKDQASGEPGRSGQRASKDEDDEDEEDLAARALQHLLVQRGALLLPIWGIEIVPGFTYGHTSEDTVGTLQSENGAPVTVGLRKRSHQLTGALTFRIGLPFDLQLEASAPLTGVWSAVTVAGAAENDSSGFGFGDPRLTLTWQLLHGGSLLPDLFVAASWKPPVGSNPYDVKAGEVGLGTGYHAIGGTVTAVKTLDPFVFLASASYTANLSLDTKAGRRNPGDSWGGGGGAILAVSPETSMSFLLDFHYKPDDTIAGKAVLASDETSAVLQLGLGTVISRHVLLNFMVGMGLTADSPGFQFGISLPVRF